MVFFLLEQPRREYREPSHGRHVLGFHHSTKEESATELCAVAQQHPL